jgi:rhodanese-related sulfurtransferase
MGPLVPHVISDEFNLIIAVFLGILFGFVLEQAGFSSTKKLVGLFYGYDFTVLKVFFTAGVTALTGVILLTHLGMLDMGEVYINPTFLWSAIVGGLIMGAGFIIGGFCPGTSLCAAAIGKIDAWAFVGGSFIGILAFTEGYPFLENLYLAEDMGFITIYEMMNLPKEVFALMLIIVAISAFFFTGLIEDKVNGLSPSYPSQQVLKYTVLGLLPFVMIAFVSFTPNKKEYMLKMAERKFAEVFTERIYPMDKLATELIDRYHSINLIDVRSPEAYEEFSIPFATNIPLDNLLDHEYVGFLTQKHKVNIFFGENKKDAKTACILACMIGSSENYILDINPEQFRQMYYEPEIPVLEASKDAKNLFRYRLKNGMQLKIMHERLKKMNAPVKKEVKRVQGGC